MKDITVRKNQKHIWFIRIFSVAFVVIFLGAMCWNLLYALPLLVVVVILTPLWIYYESWHIIFQKDKIIKKVYFGCSWVYTWNQLRKVTCARSYTEGEQIRMVFEDGKMLIFRLDDQNAKKVTDRINRHRSIEM